MSANDSALLAQAVTLSQSDYSLQNIYSLVGEDEAIDPDPLFSATSIFYESFLCLHYTMIAAVVLPALIAVAIRSFARSRDLSDVDQFCLYVFLFMVVAGTVQSADCLMASLVVYGIMLCHRRL